MNEGTQRHMVVYPKGKEKKKKAVWNESGEKEYSSLHVPLTW